MTTTTSSTTTAADTLALPSSRGLPLPNEQLWSRWEDRLAGLLEVDLFDTCYTDSDHDCCPCPFSVQLIVHLDLVRAEEAATLSHVLDAVALLCVYADRVGSSSLQDAVAFWSRISASCSWLADESLSDNDIDIVARHVTIHGVRVLLSWKDRALANDDFANALREFLHAPRRQYEQLLDGELSSQATHHHARPVKVGLHLTDFELSASQLELIVNALAIHENGDTETELLCERSVLRVLHFEGTPLGVAELEALAQGLESPSTPRCVDELRLENVVTNCDSSEYAAAFQRVLTAAFQSHPGGSVRPLTLSLGSNEMLKSIHIEALQCAMTVATRPLGGLAVDRLACEDDDAMWRDLGRIIFSAPTILASGFPSFSRDCDLDLTGIKDEGAAIETLCLTLSELVREQIPHVDVALQSSVPVYCQLRRPTHIHLNYSVGQQVKVLSVRGSRFQLETATPSSSSSSPVWVASWSIASLRIGDVDVVRCRFSSLTLSGYQENNNNMMLLLIHATGANLRRLTLCRRRLLGLILAQILDACPLLQELNLSSSDLDWSDVCVWNKLPVSSLRVLNLHFSELNCAHLDSLFLHLMRSRVCVLVLGGLLGEMRASTLRGFLSLIQANPALEYVELPKIKDVDSDDDEKMMVRAARGAIDAYCTPAEDASASTGKHRVVWGTY